MEDLQKRKNELEKEKATLNPQYGDDAFRLKVINTELEQIDAKLKAADRAQQQAEDLEDIQLPQNYDAITGYVGINEEVRSLLRQVKEQLWSRHDEELHKLVEEHLQKQQLLESEFRIQLFQAENDRKDAEQKRDNAFDMAEEAEAEKEKLARENASLKDQINELEGLLRTYKKPAASGGAMFTLTSTLKTETEEERKARLERERVEAINRNLERRGVDPLPLPALKEKEVTQGELQDAFRGVPTDEAVAPDDAGGEAVREAAAAVEPAAEAAAGLTLESLAKRVASLEKWRARSNAKEMFGLN